MEKLISIIIPVYNKAKYLHTCMQSLVDLDMDKEAMEVICVDDLSTDDSLEIINGYAEAHDFIKVIPLETNSGSPSRPRNIGFTEAQGTYLTLLDADDSLDSEGFPKLIHQMQENEADIGFGQSYKHTDKSITKMGRFSSYKNANGLVPYEIEKIFRAVGPPGKVFRRSIVIDNNIEFEHMSFGEDKLFFTELFSRCENASMTDTPVYHVNRHAENASLVRDTTILDKAAINLDILKKILKMDIPQVAKDSVVTRLVEVDFLRRFFHTKTFLRSLEKDKFYELFNEIEQVFLEHGLNIEDYIIMNRFKNIYHLYSNHEKSDLEAYIEHLVVDNKQRKYIKDGIVHERFPVKFAELEPIMDECFAVYVGTHLLDGEFYEVIQLYKVPQVTINDVHMSKIADETIQRKIECQLKDDKIYIRTEDLVFDGVDINLRIIFDDYKSVLVHSSPPHASPHYLQKRQMFKTEFKEADKKSLVPAGDYISVLPESVVALKDIYFYHDEEFENAMPEKIKAGSRIGIIDVTASKRGTPRLKTEAGYIITANKELVKPLYPRDLDSNYVTDKPEKVRIIKKCKLYDSRNFKTEPLKTLEPGEELFISDVVFTNNLTPRLKIRDNYFITANLNHVQVIS